jgi:hypothetical protein
MLRDRGVSSAAVERVVEAATHEAIVLKKQQIIVCTDEVSVDALDDQSLLDDNHCYGVEVVI